jgi:hypothetical protein
MLFVGTDSMSPQTRNGWESPNQSEAALSGRDADGSSGGDRLWP